MTRISCEVARDLLPLYCDDVCSQESRILIDEHLKNCSDCDALLKKMKMECSASTEQEMHDEEFVKAMASGWKKSVKNGFVKGVLATLILCLCLVGGYWGLTRWILTSVPSANIQANVVSVTDEHVKIILEATDGKKVLTNAMVVEDSGKLYLLEKRGVIATQTGDGENWAATYTLPKIQKTEDGESIHIKEIYYGTENDNILIWSA